MCFLGHSSYCFYYQLGLDVRGVIFIQGVIHLTCVFQGIVVTVSIFSYVQMFEVLYLCREWSILHVFSRAQQLLFLFLARFRCSGCYIYIGRDPSYMCFLGHSSYCIYFQLGLDVRGVIFIQEVVHLTCVFQGIVVTVSIFSQVQMFGVLIPFCIVTLF